MTTITKASVLNDVKRVMKATKSTSRSAYRMNGKHSSKTVEKYLGSWSKAVRMAKSKQLVIIQ